MKEVFGDVQGEAVVEVSGSRWLIDLEIRHETKDQEPRADPYEWMNQCDRWMIGKPADRACWQYLDRMISKREKNAKSMVYLYAASIVPPPLNSALLLWAFFKWMRR